MKHEHDGEWCWACINEGYRRGRLAVLRDRAQEALRKYRHQKKVNAALSEAQRRLP